MSGQSPSGGPFGRFGRDLAATLRGSAKGIGEMREQTKARREAERVDEQLGFAVAVHPDEVLESAILFMLGRGYSLADSTGRTATFSKYSPPNALLGLLLLLLLILPGVLYLILGGNTFRCSLVVTPIAGGGCRVKAGGDDRGGLRDLEDLLRTLPAATAD